MLRELVLLSAILLLVRRSLCDKSITGGEILDSLRYFEHVKLT